MLLSVTFLGMTSKVRLFDVYFAENVKENIISYGLLKAKKIWDLPSLTISSDCRFG